MVVHFDTTGLRPINDGAWVHPGTGDHIGLSVENTPLAEPFWLENIPAMRRNLAHEYARIGCLIEAEPVVLGGVRGVCQLMKARIPNAPSGQVFMASIFLAKADRRAMFSFSAEETGITGAREVAVMVKLGLVHGDGWVLPHPYASDLEGELPFHRGDDPAWDGMFPEHPLSRVRGWVRWALATATVDPAFAALPDFVPSR